jgi:hypothetical protein
MASYIGHSISIANSNILSHSVLPRFVPATCIRVRLPLIERKQQANSIGGENDVVAVSFSSSAACSIPRVARRPGQTETHVNTWCRVGPWPIQILDFHSRERIDEGLMLLLPPAVYLAQLAVDSGGDAGGASTTSSTQRCYRVVIFRRVLFSWGQQENRIVKHPAVLASWFSNDELIV